MTVRLRNLGIFISLNSLNNKRVGRNAVLTNYEFSAGLQATLRELYEDDKTFYTNGTASKRFLKFSLPLDSTVIDVYDMMGSLNVSGISTCPMKHSARYCSHEKIKFILKSIWGIRIVPDSIDLNTNF